MAGTQLHLGRLVDPATGEPTDELLHYDRDDLTTHGVIVGMTGSGKTGLACVLLEELLSAGIPALILDPKGDMPNLLLSFPESDPADFEPWVNESDARAAGFSRAGYARQQAEAWRDGTAASGVTQERRRALVDRVAYTVYTPGSTAGTPLNIVGDLRAPGADADPEDVREEAASYVSGLLGLVGIDADPLASREHVLLANIIEEAWRADRSLDLATLVGQTIEPPFRKLGVFEVDAFYPPDDRRALAMRLNGLLASPAFAAWTEGPALDIDALLGGPGEDGRTRASVVYLAHLSDAERQFVVATLLARVVTWMRGQAGTSGLRAAIYMDEVFGFAPPTAEPPAKRPILTLLKQARAYGVATVLATQNPVDLDYKAMSNAGTWMVGRLQTERDQARILEGMSAAGGGVDSPALSKRIASLGSRQFVLHNTHERSGPRLFATRWAASFLRGPITRDQIAELPNVALPPVPAAAHESGPAAGPPAKPAPAEALAPDLTAVAPEVGRGVPVRYVDAAAPWARELGATPGGTTLEAALVARVHLRFDDRAAGVDHREEWEAVLWPLDGTPRTDAVRPVDYDPRDLRDTPPPGAVYRLPDAAIGEAAMFADFGRALRDDLQRQRAVEIYANRELRLYSRVGETRDAFLERCHAMADDRADADAAKLRDRFEGKMDRVRRAINKAQDRVEQLDVDTRSRRSHELISAAGSLLSTFLGGRSSARTVAGRLGRSASGASSRRGTTTRTEQRLRNAKDDVLEREEQLEALEDDLRDDVADIVEKWDAIAEVIEERPVGLERDDVAVDEVALAWLPVG